MVKKIFLGVVVFTLCFCINFLDVNATSTYGYCIYNFNDEAIAEAWGSGQGNYLSVMIKQTSDETFTYYYSKENTSFSTSGDWHIYGGNLDDYVVFIDPIDDDLFESVNDTYSDCPPYAFLSIRKNGSASKYYVTFASNEWDALIRPNKYGLSSENVLFTTLSYGGFEGTAYSDDGVGVSCDETNVDWIFDTDSYEVSCLYQDSSTSSCYWVQLSFNSDSLLIEDINGFQYTDSNLLSDIKDSYGMYCPQTLYSVVNASTSTVTQWFELDKTKLWEKLGGTYDLHVSTLKDSTVDSVVDPIIIDYTIDELDCDDIITGNVKTLLKGIINLVRILVPILLVVLGVVDFGGSVFAGDEDKIKKAQSKFIRRVLIAVVFFLIPILLKFILTIAYNIWGVVDPSLCGLLDWW